MLRQKEQVGGPVGHGPSYLVILTETTKNQMRLVKGLFNAEPVRFCCRWFVVWLAGFPVAVVVNNTVF